MRYVSMLRFGTTQKIGLSGGMNPEQSVIVQLKL
jgi:hypothetical protein